jgi:hypothetical protein
MITVFIHELYCFGDLVSVDLCFLSIFYQDLDCKAISKLGVIGLSVHLSDMFGKGLDGGVIMHDVKD